MTCYSTVDNGYGYRGSITDRDCVSWKKFNTFSVSQYAAAGLGDHRYCRNPDPLAKSNPWCYEDDGDIEDCSVSKCTNGIVSRDITVSDLEIVFTLQMVFPQ